jgi:para-aminobenzoate synthetase / 4-amino-4-deoxychorismate lyase
MSKGGPAFEFAAIANPAAVTNAHFVAQIIAAQQPFVLLDDARAVDAAPARLFTDPIEICAPDGGADVAELFATLDRWQAEGAWGAGWLGYEAGLTLEQRSAPLAKPTPGWPLAWFARFATMRRITAHDIPALLPHPDGAMLGAVTPSLDFDAYRRSVETILEAIRAGDIYQANLTFNATVGVTGHPLALYARLRRSARAGYGGIVFTGTHWLLSCSPELFISQRGCRLITRPMKGTATRHTDPTQDRAAAAALAADPKQRAENLMIVDLIRNDLSRIAVPGSVSVTDLFRIETYPTVHQMVSDISAQLSPGATIGDVLRAAFPCGSITGAPKLQAMATIAAVERGPRNAYTGSIGFIGPGDDGGGEAAFNVAIRTLSLLGAGALQDGANRATLGLGSGIVADSAALAEWHECLAKGAFVTQASRCAFDLIETIAFDPVEGMPLLDLHLARLGNSAAALGFRFDRHEIRNRLQHATFRRSTNAKVRMRLAPEGHTAIAVSDAPPPPTEPLKVALVPLPVPPQDIRLCHKSSSRRFYDVAREISGVDEVLFLTSDGYVTEGSFTNLFVERGGALLTPQQAHARLPGVLRQSLLNDGRAQEAAMTPDDLSGVFLLGNALRGLMPARLQG